MPGDRNARNSLNSINEKWDCYVTDVLNSSGFGVQDLISTAAGKAGHENEKNHFVVVFVSKCGCQVLSVLPSRTKYTILFALCL